MNKNIDFETALSKLETIIQKLESGNIGLNDSINLYEEGMALSDMCNHMLEDATKRVEVIKSNYYEANEFESDEIPEVNDEL